MVSMPVRKLALAVMLAAAGVCLAAQDRPATSSEEVVTGFVRYASGAAVADVRVALIDPRERTLRSARTTVDGSDRFDAVPAGEYQLSVTHAGAVAKQIKVTSGSELRDVNFFIPDGSSRRAVTGRVVMNAASRGEKVPARIGVGVFRTDGTLVLPLAPGDQRVVVSLPPGYFLETVSYGPETVYSLESVGGKRLSAAPFSITVPPEPGTLPELVITLGVFR